jgi:hypothetical protein
MDAYETILLTLGEIKGELAVMRKLNDRVARLEIWQAWLKGAWAVMASAFIWKAIFRH